MNAAAATTVDDSPAALFSLALDMQRRGSHLRAEALYQKILETESRYPAVHANLGVLLAQRGDFSGAERSYRLALALAPDQADVLSNLGNALFQQGKLEDAIASYRKALRREPGNHAVRCNLARALHGSGDDAAARQEFAAVLSQAPGHAGALAGLRELDGAGGDAGDVESRVKAMEEKEADGGRDEAIAMAREAVAAHPTETRYRLFLASCLARAGKHAEAIPEWREVVRMSPHSAQVYVLLGDSLAVAGDPAEAEIAYRMALAFGEKSVAVYNNLANALMNRNAIDEAEAEYRKALEVNPNAAEAFSGLGNVMMARKNLAEAEQYHRKAVALRPFQGDFRSNLALLLAQSGRIDEAIEEARRAVELEPTKPDFQSNLGNMLRRRGRTEEALLAYFRAVELNPAFGPVYTNIGLTLQEQHRTDEAIPFFIESVRAQPDKPVCYNNLAAALLTQHKFDDALSILFKAIDVDPNYAEAYCNIANALREKGRCDQSIEFYRKALSLRPDFHEAHSNMLFAMNYVPDLSPLVIYNEARTWNQRQSANAPALPPARARDRRPDRQLRIGFVSGDFRRHPVGYFLTKYLAHRDPAEVFVACYATNPVDDSQARLIRSRVDLWRNVAIVTEEEAAHLVRQDEIDVLIDLAGHTAYNGLRTFMRRPAPVQVSWLGYPSTTGLDAMDWRLTDEVADPPGLADIASSERLFRMPRGFHCYDPPAETVPVGPSPAARNGYVTFGCFNTLAKSPPATLALWARILNEVPDARLFMKAPGLHDETTKRRILEEFSRCGVDPARIRLMGRTPSLKENFELYNEVDIALDPFPYNGTTTTCDSAWMGVPTVTLAGIGQQARMGASINTRIGLGEFIAGSADEYVEIAKRWAADRAGLAGLRNELRERMARSPLCDGAGFARDLETAFRFMWCRYVAEGEPAAAAERAPAAVTPQIAGPIDPLRTVQQPALDKAPVATPAPPPGSPQSPEAEKLQQAIKSFPFWYHKIELPNGVTTPGWAPIDARAYGIPERLDGLRVLDVGAWDGFWTFEALKRGAREAVAIDDFSDYLGTLDKRDRKAWQTFDLCREALGFSEERCKRIETTVYDVSEELLGRFDVVFFFGTLYHLRHPLLALDRLASVCDGEIYVETAILDDFSPYRGGLGCGYPGNQMVMEFYPGKEYGRNETNWWAPTVSALKGMVSAAGFTEDVRGWKLVDRPTQLSLCRGFATGRKPRSGGGGKP